MKNTEVLNGILDELEVIKLRAEHFEKQNKSYSGDLYYVLQKLEEVSEFLKPSKVELSKH